MQTIEKKISHLVWNLSFQISKLANGVGISEAKTTNFLCTCAIINMDTTIPHIKWESSQ